MIDDRTAIKDLIREVLAEMFTSASTSIPASGAKWVSLKDAVSPLQYPSPESLRRAISSGVLRMGKEVRDRRNPGAKKPIYQINITLAQKRLNEDPAKRQSV